MSNFFAFLTDNLCDNALNLANGQLNIENNWPLGTYCQWLILAQDDNGYVTLEFQNFNVRNIIGFKNNLILEIVVYRNVLDILREG